MRDHVARELKGHNILAVERFQDKTRWMVEFSVLRPRTAYGAPGDENAPVSGRGRLPGRSRQPETPGHQNQTVCPRH